MGQLSELWLYLVRNQKQHLFFLWPKENLTFKIFFPLCTISFIKIFQFTDEEIDGLAVRGLVEQDLCELFPKKGPRAKFRALLAKVGACNKFLASLCKARESLRYTRGVIVRVCVSNCISISVSILFGVCDQVNQLNLTRCLSLYLTNYSSYNHHTRYIYASI